MKGAPKPLVRRIGVTNSSDSFIDEVTEEVRQDKLYGYLRRYGWIGILAVLLLVGGAAYNEWNRAREAAAAQALGDAFYAALEAEGPLEQADQLAALPTDGAASAPAAMLEAAALAEAGETERAAEIWAALAADPGHPRVWRDLAALKRVLLLGRTLPADERLAVLAPLATPGAPYRVLAREQEALAHLDAGDQEAAVAIFEALMVDQEATQGLRLRAAQLMVALGATSNGT